MSESDDTRRVRQARRERLRVILPFSLAIGPPLVLLTVLAVVAAENDEKALRFVEEERTRQAAERAVGELSRQIRRSEAAVLATLLAEPDSPPDFQGAARAHPLVKRFFAARIGDGVRLWPRANLPFSQSVLATETPPDEAPAQSAEELRRRSELLDLYAKARAQQEAKNLYNAVAGFRTVAESESSTPTLQARASFRLGECLLELDQQDAAQLAFHEAAQAPLPVRDERGRPLRVLSALRCAELQAAAGQTESAIEEARRLCEGLLAGARQRDVGYLEWKSILARGRALLVKLGQTEVDAGLAARGAEVEARLQWEQSLDDLLPGLLEQARRSGGSELRHFARIGNPPRVLAYRVQQGSGASVVLGFELALDRLADEVLGPTCADLNLREDVSLAILDAQGRVVAHAGAAAAPSETGKLLDLPGMQATSLALDLVPLWRVEVRRTTAQALEARRNRLILYGALLGLTLAAAATGAVATLRYVQRSLELARMKSDFVSNMTHELKTPLTSIRMYGELLGRPRFPKDHKRIEYADHIVTQADRLQRLIEDVLDFARQDSGKHDYVLAEADVADVVAEAIDLFRLSAKVRGYDLFVELPPIGELPAVDLDRDAIVRSVLNLLSNAVKYSTEEKYIKVWVVRHSPEQIGIVVKDRGIGIDPEDLELIFNRFYRAGDELTRGVSGAGLGLSLIDQIVRAHGGEIQVESEKGQGSMFTILLPIVEDYREQWPPPDLTQSDDELEPELETDSDAGAPAPPPPAVAVPAKRRRSSFIEVLPSDLGEVELDSDELPEVTIEPLAEADDPDPVQDWVSEPSAEAADPDPEQDSGSATEPPNEPEP
ncbi:MAG: HAMP domain-containing histidine kinase [Planctomycetes bacterium]|nr:HAMP domain-containing histidine kinase [Planctomycetota bacterium]